MASLTDSPLTFFSKGTPEQFSYVLGQYREIFNVHAQETRGTRKNGPAELIKLDNWYQETLPQIIKNRKDKQLIYEELVQVVKWKLLRGKFRPSLLDLVKTNTETAVKNITKKAFKKMPNIGSAVAALTTLKGIAPATASAILVAHSPNVCPYMADENMASTPGVEVSDLSISEYLNYVEQTNICVERLRSLDPKNDWTPHKVELAIWTHYHIKHYNSNILDKMPATSKLENGLEKINNGEEYVKHLDEYSNQSLDEKSNKIASNENSNESVDKVNNHIQNDNNSLHEEETNLSAPTSSVTLSSASSSSNSEIEDKSNDSILNNREDSSLQSISNLITSNTEDKILDQHENGNSILKNHNNHNNLSLDKKEDFAAADEIIKNKINRNHFNGTISPTKTLNRIIYNSDISHSKDAIISSSEDNSNNILSEENSNLSNFNLSYTDLNSNDNAMGCEDGPALKRIRVE